MTARKKKGIGFAITSVLFGVVAIVFLAFTSTPDWVSTGLEIATVVAEVLGFSITIPAITDSSSSSSSS